MMWALHIMAVIFFLPALFITIPAHIISGKLEARKVVNNNNEKEVIWKAQEKPPSKILEVIEIAGVALVLGLWVFSD